MNHLSLKPQWSDKEYRDAYLDASIEQGIAWQIRINRQLRGLTEDEFADLLKIEKPELAKLENPEEGTYNLEDLVRIAKVFDCALEVKFIPYSELARNSLNLSEQVQFAAPYSSEVVEYD